METQKKTRAEIKAERDAERARAQALKEQQKKEHSEACKAAEAASRKPPQSFQTWGVIKTRCWLTICKRVKSLSKVRTVSRAAEIRDHAAMLLNVENWGPEKCSEYLDGLRAAKLAAKQQRSTKK